MVWFTLLRHCPGGDGPGEGGSCAANRVVVSTQRRKGARAQRLKLGLVVNFGERLVKDGIHRVVNGL
jgi:hypothetical protein